MKGLLENITGTALFNDNSCIHDIDLISQSRHDPQIMGNVQKGL
jgi:hypothetical protein